MIRCDVRTFDLAVTKQIRIDIKILCTSAGIPLTVSRKTHLDLLGILSELADIARLDSIENGFYFLDFRFVKLGADTAEIHTSVSPELYLLKRTTVLRDLLGVLCVHYFFQLHRPVNHNS